MKKLSTETLRQLFNDEKIKDEQSFKQVLFESIECYAGGFQFKPTIAFIFQADFCVDLPNTESIRIFWEPIGERNGLIFQLLDEDREDLFAKICLDLITSVQHAISEANALSNLALRYRHWQDLFRKKQNITEQAIQGLVGELLYLEKLLKKYPPETVITAWHGPLNANQDFVIPQDNRWIEVKTIGQNGNEITISSIEQLLNPESSSSENLNVDGCLAVVQVHRDPASKNAFSLVNLVARIQAKLEDSPAALNSFNLILESTGADLVSGNKEKSLKFELLNIYEYDANASDFPKLRRQSIPFAIIKASYILSLPALNQWIIK